MSFYGVPFTALLGYSEVRAACAQVGWLVVLFCCVEPFLWRSLSIGAFLVANVVLLSTMFWMQRRIASGLPTWLPFSAYRLQAAGSSANPRFNSNIVGQWSCPLKGGVRPVSLVTGGNTGIGLHCAEELASMGFDVLLCCRSKPKAEDAIAAVLRFANADQPARRSLRKALAAQGSVTELSGFSTPGAVAHVALDLEDEASIRRAVADILARTPVEQIAVLVNNAGMFSPVLHQTTSCGHEKLIGVNFTGTVLFTELVLRAVSCAPQRRQELRVVNVSSIAHTWSRLPPGTTPLSLLRDATTGRCITRNTYGVSKLLLIMYTRALSRRLEKERRSTKVTVVSVHPGAVLTDIFRELGIVARLMPVLLQTIFKTPEEGAETSLFAALGPVKSGSYYADCKLADAALSPWAQDVSACDAVMECVLQCWKLPSS